MARLSGDFQTDLSPPDTLVACAEAIDGIGWHVVSVKNRRIVAFSDRDAPYSPMIELRLAKFADGTDIRILGTDADRDGELITQLEELREAIGARIAATPGPEKSRGTDRQRRGPRDRSPAPNLLRRTALSLAAILIASGCGIAGQHIPATDGKRQPQRPVVSIRPSAAQFGRSSSGSDQLSPGRSPGAWGSYLMNGRGGSSPAPAQGTPAESSLTVAADGQLCEQGPDLACGIAECHRLSCPTADPPASPPAPSPASPPAPPSSAPPPAPPSAPSHAAPPSSHPAPPPASPSAPAPASPPAPAPASPPAPPSSAPAHTSPPPASPSAPAPAPAPASPPPAGPPAPAPSSGADWSAGLGTYTSSGRIWPGASWRPYAGLSGGPQGVSAFNRPVPASPPIATSEQRYARELETTFSGFNRGAGSPVFFADSSDPDVTIHAPGSPDGVNGRVVDVPRNAQSEGVWDSHISIINSSSGVVTECWLGHVDWGHDPPLLNANNCDQEPISGDGMLTPYAVTAGGISKIAGEVWPSEFAAGVIPHALVLNVPCVSGHAYPVTVSNDNCDGPWLGGRVWLDLTQAQINAIPSRNARILAQAFHDYGAYIRDSGNGGGWEIGSVSGSSWTLMGAPDPWSGFQGISGSAIPWSGHLHILDPCTARGSC